MRGSTLAISYSGRKYSTTYKREKNLSKNLSVDSSPDASFSHTLMKGPYSPWIRSRKNRRRTKCMQRVTHPGRCGRMTSKPEPTLRRHARTAPGQEGGGSRIK